MSFCNKQIRQKAFLKTSKQDPDRRLCQLRSVDLTVKACSVHRSTLNEKSAHLVHIFVVPSTMAPSAPHPARLAFCIYLPLNHRLRRLPRLCYRVRSGRAPALSPLSPFWARGSHGATGSVTHSTSSAMQPLPSCPVGPERVPPPALHKMPSQTPDLPHSNSSIHLCSFFCLATALYIHAMGFIF